METGIRRERRVIAPDELDRRIKAAGNGKPEVAGLRVRWIYTHLGVVSLMEVDKAADDLKPKSYLQNRVNDYAYGRMTRRWLIRIRRHAGKVIRRLAVYHRGLMNWTKIYF